MALASSGCVIAGPPDYKDPGQTPPVLDLQGASPSISKVINVDTPTAGQPAATIHISVPVRSGDGGDYLVGMLFVDYGTTDEVFQPGLGKTSPSTSFDTLGRTMKMPWTVTQAQPQGCHTLTLLVTHLANADTGAGKILDTADLATATWWVDIDDNDPQNPIPLSDCPSLSP